MRDDDDHPLAGINLAAWQPPPPPANLADAVIARMRQPTPAVAVAEPDERASRRSIRLAGLAGLAAAAALAGGLAMWGTRRAPRDGRGALIAARAEHLALDDTTADLDPGAELRWTRDGRGIIAHQQRGTVRWTVANDDILMIDPGGAGSAGSTATIEASGASLRVEVPMNLSDTRVLGVTTAVAAVAALATVTVYQGHIKATSGGQTVQIEPGATIELRSGQLPQPPSLHAGEPIAVGAGDVQALQAKLAAANKQIAELTARLPGAGDAPAETAHTDVSPAALDQLRLSGDRNVVPDAATQQAMELAGNPSLDGTFRLCVDTHGAVSSVQRIKSTRFDKYDQEIERAMRGWTYKPFLIDDKPVPVCTAITYVYTRDTDPPRHALRLCEKVNIDDAVTQAANQYSNGFASAALSIMRGVLACKQDARMYRLGALYACAAHDAATARQLLAKLPTTARPAIEQRCQQEGIAVAAGKGR